MTHSLPGLCARYGRHYRTTMSREFTKHVTIKATDGDRRVAHGVALVPNEVDHQSDWFAPDAVNRLADDYMTRLADGGVDQGVMHVRFPDDDIALTESRVLSEPDTIGDEEYPAGTWEVGFKVLNDELWSLVDGSEPVLGAFSIGGSIESRSEVAVSDLPDEVSVPESVSLGSDDPTTEIVDGELSEISLVDMPAVPRAQVATIKADLRKNEALTDPDRAQDVLEDRGHSPENAERLAAYLTKGMGKASELTQKAQGVDIFRIIAPDDGDYESDLLGMGVDMPNHDVYVDWHLEAFGDDALDNPHVSIYGSLADLNQVTDGDIDSLGTVSSDIEFVKSVVLNAGVSKQELDPDVADCKDSVLEDNPGMSEGEAIAICRAQLGKEEIDEMTDTDEKSEEDLPGGSMEACINLMQEDGRSPEEAAEACEAILEDQEQEQEQENSTDEESESDGEESDKDAGQDESVDVDGAESDVDLEDLNDEQKGFLSSFIGEMKDTFAPSESQKDGRTIRSDNLQRLMAAYDATASAIQSEMNDHDVYRFTDDPDVGFDISEYSGDGAPEPEGISLFSKALFDGDTEALEKSLDADGTEGSEDAEEEGKGENETTMSDDNETDETADEKRIEELEAELEDLRNKFDEDDSEKSDESDSEDDEETPAWAKALIDQQEKNAERIEELTDEDDSEKSLEDAPEWAKELHEQGQKNADRIDAVAKGAANSDQIDARDEEKSDEDEDGLGKLAGALG